MVAKLECRECGQMNRAGTPCHCGGPKVPTGSGMGSKTLAERLRSRHHWTDTEGDRYSTPINPDGEEAADALDAKDAEIARLKAIIRSIGTVERLSQKIVDLRKSLK